MTTATSYYHIEERDQRMWAAAAHLSGFSYVLVPGGGIIVPIILMLLKSDDVLTSSVARQALYLNIACIIAGVASFMMIMTIVLIPFAILLGAIAAIFQVVLPIIGAIRSMDGTYYRYPIVGHDPS